MRKTAGVSFIETATARARADQNFLPRVYKNTCATASVVTIALTCPRLKLSNTNLNTIIIAAAATNHRGALDSGSIRAHIAPVATTESAFIKNQMYAATLSGSSANGISNSTRSGG